MERKSSYSTAYKYKGTSCIDDKKSEWRKRRSMHQRDLRDTVVNKKRQIEELSPVQDGVSMLSDKSYHGKTPTKPKDEKLKAGEKRLEQLKKWKAEKEARRQQEQGKQKPTFTVRKMSHKDQDIYNKNTASKPVVKPVNKPAQAPVRKVTKASFEPEPTKTRKVTIPVSTKSYEKPTLGYMARKGVEQKTAPVTRQTRSQSRETTDKGKKAQVQPVTKTRAGRSTRSTVQTETHRTKQTTATSKKNKVEVDIVVEEPAVKDLSLTKVSTFRGERTDSSDSTYSFAPNDYTFSAPSFVFNPLSPNSAQNFLNPGQDTCVSFLDHNPNISSTPKGQKRQGRSAERESKKQDSTLRESPKSSSTLMRKGSDDTDTTTLAQPTEELETEFTSVKKLPSVDSQDENVNSTIVSEQTVKTVEEIDDSKSQKQSKQATPMRRSSRRSVLSTSTVEEKSSEQDLETKQTTPAPSGSRRSRRSVQTSITTEEGITLPSSGRKSTRKSVSTDIKEADQSVDQPSTRRSARKSAILSSENEVIPDKVIEDKRKRRSVRKSVIISTERELIPETVPEESEEDNVFVNTDKNKDSAVDNVETEKENSAEETTDLDSIKASLLCNEDILNSETEKKQTPGRRGAKTRNKSFAGFRIPEAQSVPLSASAKRRRRKTVMPKSPEEWVELLSKSPMVEMTRRTPKLNSSVLDIDFSDVDLSSPLLFKETQPKKRSLSDPTDMPSDPKLNLFQALQDSEGSSSVSKQADQESDKQTSENTEQVVKQTGEAMEVDKENDKSSASENINKEETASEVHDVKYFRNLLVTETNRLKGLCKQWEEINSANSLTEEVSGQIRTTVGQAVLLMDQRFKQFTGLVDNCEFKTGEKETTCTDLDGFWDMIYFQVEDVDNKFEKLRKLRDNNWVDQEQKPVVKKVKKKVTKPAVTKPAVKSKFAAFRAQMKKKQEVAQSPNVMLQAAAEEKVFEMPAFFSVASPVRSPAYHCEGGTPKKKERPAERTEEVKPETEQTDKPSTDKPMSSLSAPSSTELLMRRTPYRKSYAPAIPSPLLVDSTPQPRPVRSCTKKTPMPRQLLNDENDSKHEPVSADKENEEATSAKKSKRRSVRARKSVNFNEIVPSPKLDTTATANDTIAEVSTCDYDPANMSEEKFVDDDVFARFLQPRSLIDGNAEKENSPRSPKRQRLSSGLKSCPSSNKRRSSHKKVQFTSTSSDDSPGMKMPRTPAPTERRVTRRSLSQTSENQQDFFDFGFEHNSPKPSTRSPRPSLLYTPPDLPNRPVRPLTEVPTATLISFTP